MNAAAALHPALLRASAEGRSNLPPPPPTDYPRPPSRPSSSTPIAALSPHVTSDLSTAAAHLGAAKGLPSLGGSGNPDQHPPPTPTPSDLPPGLAALVQQFPVSWQGYLTLKNDYAFIQMHFVSGNQELARHALPTEQSAPMTPGGAPLTASG